MRTRCRILSVFCCATFLAGAAPPHAAEIKVLSDTPLSTALTRIAAAFSRESGHQVQFEFGISPAIHKKVTDGEGDVVVIQPDFISDLVSAGKVVAGTYPIIARVGIGLFTRADAEVPDISTVAAFKQAMLHADTVVYSTVASGNYFATVLERLGIPGTIPGKIMRARPSEVVGRVVQGKGRDIGVSVVTLIIADKRLKLIGPLPPDYQSQLVYAAAPTVTARSPEAAKAFARFLSSPEAQKAFVASGAN